ncbi:MAG: hypothetical protein J7K72_03395, partial [Candidatus Aenigmarchaeota archaeon]|nr:hypothetical protein [Candidatus Aenigmarchaeota archaeon]
VMDIKTFHKEVEELFNKISDKRGQKHTEEEIFIHLIEEIGEIARQLTNKKIREEKFDHKNLEEEISDSIMFLIYLASLYKIDLENSLKKDVEKLKIKFKIQ